MKTHVHEVPYLRLLIEGLATGGKDNFHSRRKPVEQLKPTPLVRADEPLAVAGVNSNALRTPAYREYAGFGG